jgi:hypothetical protein
MSRLAQLLVGVEQLDAADGAVRHKIDIHLVADASYVSCIASLC